MHSNKSYLNNILYNKKLLVSLYGVIQKLLKTPTFSKNCLVYANIPHGLIRYIQTRHIYTKHYLKFNLLVSFSNNFLHGVRLLKIDSFSIFSRVI